MPRELTVELDNRPGTLAELGETLGKVQINIIAFAGFGIDGKGLGKIVVEDAKGARTALEGVGIRVLGDKEAFIVKTVKDTPGSLGTFARKVANAGVNIESSYQRGTELVFTFDNPQKAKALL